MGQLSVLADTSESQHSVIMGTNQEEQTESVFFDCEHPTNQARGILVTVGSKDGKGVYSEYRSIGVCINFYFFSLSNFDVKIQSKSI